MGILSWVKNNKLVLLLFLVILFLFFRQNRGPIPLVQNMMYRDQAESTAVESVPMMGVSEGKMGMMPPLPPVYNDVAPRSDVSNRLVVQESSLSLVVDQVRTTSDKIVNFVSQNGGYMVSTSLTAPDEAPFATVVVRIPANQMQTALDFFRGLSVKVSSENIIGFDVTDEYEDIDERLKTLQLTKEKFESILKSAQNVEDILNVQRELISLQSQIDSFKGRQQYLEKNAQLAKMTIYLSSDELSLPFTPTNRFRPEVILKQAIRSLLQHAQQIGEWLIWSLVYAPVWLPVIILSWFFYRKNHT